MSWFIPGMGMFCEAYFIFSIGNIKQIFPYEYPNCWKAHATCSVNMTRAPDYMQIVGIVFGMCTLGYLGDKIGREPLFQLICCLLYISMRMMVKCLLNYKITLSIST